jgi:hypothetical protein
MPGERVSMRKIREVLRLRLAKAQFAILFGERFAKAQA